MNEVFQKEKDKIFKNMSFLCVNSFTQNIVEMGTFIETQKLITKFEMIENENNKILEIPKFMILK